MGVVGGLVVGAVVGARGGGGGGKAKEPATVELSLPSDSLLPSDV